MKNKLSGYLCLCIPALAAASILLVVYAAKGLFVFGDNCLCVYDAQAQYLPFLAELSDRLTNGGSLMFSWQAGMGYNFFATMCYYLMTPFNLLALLLKNVLEITQIFDLIILLKAAVSASVFGWYLNRRFGRFDVITVLFSLFYAFCGFFSAYYFNTMWTDALIYLPVIAFGIERLVNDAKSVTYCIVLALSILGSFYMGYMLCIFSVLYFIVCFISSDTLCKPSKSSGSALNDIKNSAALKCLFRFGFYSLIAGAIAAVTLLPVYFSLQNAALKDETGTHGLLLFSFAEFVFSHLCGVDTLRDTVEIGSYPNSYFGVFPLILVTAFPFIKTITIRERIAWCGFSGVLIASLFISPINLVWHGMSAPCSMPHRFVFIYTFVMLLMAYRVWRSIKVIKARSFIAFGAVLMVATAIIWIFNDDVFKGFYEQPQDDSLFLVNIMLIVSASVLLVIAKMLRTDNKIVKLLALVVCIADISLNLFSVVQCNPTEFVIAQKENISESVVKSDGFLRTEHTEYIRPGRLSGSLYGYNQLSTFSSLNDTYASFAIGNFGIMKNNMNAFIYKEQTPLFNSFFGVSRLVDMNEILVREDLYEQGEAHVYNYKYPLSLGFCVDEDYKLWDGGLYFGFDSQNMLFYNCTGKLVFDKRELEFINADGAKLIPYLGDNAINELVGKDKIVYEMLNDGLYQFEIEDFEGIKGTNVTFSIKVPANEAIFLSVATITFPYITIKGENYSENYFVNSEFLTLSAMFPLPVSNTEQTYEIILESGEELEMEYNNDIKEVGVTSSVKIKAAAFDMDTFLAEYERIKAGELKIEAFEDTYVKGTVNAQEDCTLFLSMIYDRGWSAKIDGVEADTVCTKSHLLALDLTAGEHTVELSYEAPGLRVGAAISASALGLLALLTAVGYITQKRKNTGLPE